MFWSLQLMPKLERMRVGRCFVILVARLLFLLYFPSASQAHDLYLLPSFQGTLLHNNGKYLHLSPLTPSTYRKLYSILSEPKTTISRYTDYPSITCAPLSHVGHCIPLPAEGVIAELQVNYNVTPIPYDWRLHSSKLVPTLSDTISRIPHGGVLLAHGTACRLATLLDLSNIKLVCLSPISSSFAHDALTRGEGLLTLGEAHRYHHPGHRNSDQIDFRLMEHELGLVSKRRLLPETPGPWDERDTFAAPQEARIELAGKLESVREYANGGDVNLDESSLCIQGSGVGEGCAGCSGKVVQVDIAFFDVAGLLNVALKELD